ncbi:Taurine catabolism dioxygenase TauD, TfdA family [Rhodospirillales bacterium URHD0017]|nr:Taurine catabolism dioxygenase TauD, TfdA family [Rhodospirillales bacterium URHD0017]
MLGQALPQRLLWRGDTLSEGAGRIALPDAVEKELDGVAASLDREPLPLLLLRPNDFALDASRAFMRKVKSTIDDGPGFAIVDRLPVERWSADSARAVWWLLASLVARPVAQKWDGTSIYDVTDLGRPPGNGVRPDVTNAEQNFHTDNSYNHVPPHYVGLMCLRTAMAGGVSGIVSFATAHEEMQRRHPDLLARLYRPFYFDRQREHAPGDVMTTHHPMLEAKDGRLIARLSHFQVKNGQKLAGVPLDNEGAAALEAFEAILNEPGMSARFQFQPGQMQLIDNRALGHKRTAFRDWPDDDRKRLLVRLWLRDSGSRAYNG